MRFSSISIDGYGLFHNVSLDDLPGGLVILEGDNEAGKSTLLGFIRSILFGFPRKDRKDFYPPLEGGTHGGRLGLVMADGREYIVERHAGKHRGSVTLTAADGSVEGEDSLSHFMAGASEDLYRNVYGFSLQELQELGSLQNEGVKSVIYGASIGAAMLSLPDARKRIETRLSELFKPGGSKSFINTQLKKLKEVRSKLKEARKGIADYDAACDELTQVTQDIEAMRADLARLEAEHQRLAAYIELWPHWIDLQRAEAELAALPEVIDAFPEQSVAALHEITAALREKGREQAKDVRRIERPREEHGRLHVDESLLAQAEAIALLGEDRKSFTNAFHRIPTAGQEAESLDEDIRQRLHQLGAEWSEERALAVDRSLFTREAIHTHERYLAAARAALDQAAHEMHSRENEREDEVRKEAGIVARLDEMPLPEAVPDEQALRRLKDEKTRFHDAIQDLPGVEADRRTKTKRLDEAVKEIDPRWRDRNVADFDTSLAAFERVRNFKGRLDEARRHVLDARNHCQNTRHALAEKRDALERAREELSNAPVPKAASRDELVNRRTAIRDLRRAFTEQDRLHTELAHKQERLADKHQTQRMPQGAGFPVFGWATAGLAGVLLAIAVVLWLDWPPLARAAAVLVCLALPCAFWAGVQGLRRRIAAAGPEAATLNEAIRTLNGEIEALRQRSESGDAAVARLREGLGPAAPLAPEDLDQLEDDAGLELSHFDARVRLEAGLRAAHDDVARKEEDLKEAEAALASRTAQVEAIQKDWEAFLSELRLAPSLDPAMAQQVFDKVKAARDRSEELEKTEHRVEQMRSTRDAYRALGEGFPALAGLAGDSDETFSGKVETFLAQAEQQQTLVEKRRVDEKALDDQRKRREEAEARMEEARVRHEGAAQEDSEAHAAWQAWLAERDLPTGLSPDTAVRALDTLDACLDVMAKRRAAQQETEKNQNLVADYEARAAAVFAALGRAAPSGEALAVAVAQLTKEVQEQRDTQGRKKEKQGQIDELEAAIAVRKGEIDDLDREKATLLDAANAANEEDFHRRADLYKARQRLLDEITEKGKTISSLAREKDLEVLREKLGGADHEEWVARHTERGSEIEDLKEQLEALRNTRARLKIRIDQMAGADDIARLRAQEEALLAQIEDAADEWRRHALAGWLLGAACERFERESQPDVIRDAGRFFKQITGGAYHEVLAPIGQEALEVIGERNIRRTCEELSRGTAEQLYLALRFGYIRHRSAQGEALPVVMDDILVNFDPHRARNAAETVLELARDHQVLFFTCHPGTAALFRKLDAAVPMYRIEQGEFIPATTTRRGKKP